MSNASAAEALTLSQLPLFPLQSVLFPGGWLPLRIFEVRYLDMIGRCHKAGAPFGVVCLSEGSEVRRIDPAAPPTGDAFAKEVFHPVGTMVQIEQLERPQPGLMMIRCKGTHRFHVTRRHQLPHGLWVADVRLDDKETVVPVPEHLVGTRDALQRLLKNLEVTMDRPETVVDVFGAALKRYPRVAGGDDVFPELGVQRMGRDRVVAGPTAPATQVALNRTVQTMAANLRPISVLNMGTSSKTVFRVAAMAVCQQHCRRRANSENGGFPSFRGVLFS